MTRVLNLLWGFSQGGIAQYIRLIQRVSQVAPLELRQGIILAPEWDTDRSTLEQVEHRAISIRGRLDFGWLPRTRELIRELEPDLVLTHGFNGHFVARLCQRRSRRPLPLACSYHGRYHAITPLRRPVGRLVDRFTEHVIRRHALGTVAVAEHCRRHLLSRGIPPDRIRVIHNGLPPRLDRPEEVRARLRAQWGVQQDEVLIGSASRLDPVKGIGDLIQAFAGLPEDSTAPRLVIIGRGAEQDRLQGLAARLGLGERCRFLGFRGDVAECLEGIDIFALPSLAEYHSIALLEAMRAGRAIVATDVGGNPESVHHDRHGLIVAPGDPTALTAALGELIRDPALRERQGLAARERFQKEFTEELMVERTARWMEEMAGLAEERRSGGRG